MRSTLLRLTIIASFVALLTFAITIPNRGFTSRAIVFNGTSQYARVTLPNSAPWTSLGAFKIMGRLRGMSSVGGYIASLGIPEVSNRFHLFQNGGGDPQRIDLTDSRDSIQDFHAPNTFTDVVFKLQYDPTNSRWTLETWKADGTGYVFTTETITTTSNWNLGGHYLTLGANPYGVGLSDAHVDWWCWQQGADALGSGNFPGAEAPTGTFLVKYTFDNDDGTDSSGNGLNLTLTGSPSFENTSGGAAAPRAITFNGTSQYARVTLPNSAPWTSLGAFKIMGRLRGMSSLSGYIASLGIPNVSAPFHLFQNGGGDPQRIDLTDARDSIQDFHAPNTFTDVVFKLQYDPTNSRWTLESWKADGTGYVSTTETITTTSNWNLGGHYLTLGANSYGVGLSDAHVDWWCWQQGADALGSGNFPGAEAPNGTFLVKYTFDNDDGTDSSGNGLNLTLTGSPSFENTPGGGGNPPQNQISNINVVVACNTSALINFRTSVASHAFIEYGPTTSYGTSTIDDSVRSYTEHAIQLTGLTANTTYHFRINADSNGITQSADQVVTTASSGASCTALPAQVDSRMPDMAGAVEYLVKANCTGFSNCFTNFQTALNTAGTDNGKRFITVDAGLTLTNQWLMPANSDQNWIIIRSSAHASLPEGKRVVPTDASNMFKIQNNNVDPPIIFAAGSNHIRIIGAEVTIDPAAVANAPSGPNVGAFFDFTKNVTNQASLPKFIGVDRSYVHGWPNKNTGRGAFAMGEDLFFIDNYFYDFHLIGNDAQAILGLDVKRWKLLNNTLVGTSENFMWGGDGLRIDGYVIGELEYLRNHMYVPCSWKPDGGCGATYEGIDWPEKNLFECKTCAKVFVFGNFFGGTTDAQGGFWPDAQSKPINLKLEQNSGRVVSVAVTNGGSGYTSAPAVNFSANPGCVHGFCAEAEAIVSGGQVTGVTMKKGGLGYCIAPTVSFSGGGGSGATATSTVSPQTLDRMEDIIFYKNVMKNVHAGPDIVGHTINGAANCGGVPDRVLFSHNLFEFDATTWDPEPGASAGSWNATGWAISGTKNVQIVHNTVVNANPTQSGVCNSVFGDGMMILVGDPVTPKWSGFVFKDNINDYRGCGIIGSGLPVNANNALDGVYTGYVFMNNGIVRTAGEASNFPLNQAWVTSWTSQFVNFNNGLDGNYRVASGSSWKNAASDSTDIGADIDGVLGATAHTPTGNWTLP